MPCYDPYSDREEVPNLKKRNDELARLLCEACRIIEDPKKLASPELTKWWKEHKRFDAKEGR